MRTLSERVCGVFAAAEVLELLENRLSSGPRNRARIRVRGRTSEPRTPRGLLHCNYKHGRWADVRRDYQNDSQDSPIEPCHESGLLRETESLDGNPIAKSRRRVRLARSSQENQGESRIRVEESSRRRGRRRAPIIRGRNLRSISHATRYH